MFGPTFVYVWKENHQKMKTKNRLFEIKHVSYVLYFKQPVLVFCLILTLTDVRNKEVKSDLVYHEV